MPITGKNVLGIIGLAVIALFWVALNGILGGALVAVLILVVIIVLNNTRRRKRSPPETGQNDATALIVGASSSD